MAREKLSTEKRREQIAEAALEIAATEGVKEITVSNVAAKLGLAPSALYRHYKGKEQILEAVVELMGTRLAALLDESATEADTPLQTLEILLVKIIGLAHRLPAIPMILFSEEIFQRPQEGNSKFAAILENYIKKLVQVMAEGQKAGLFTREIPPANLAIMFVGLYVPPMLLYYSSGKKFDLEGQVTSAWKLFRKVLSPAQD